MGEKSSPMEERKASNASSFDRPSLSSFSSSNDFGLPSPEESGSDQSCNVEYATDNNNSSENNETTLKKICETFKDGSADVHTLEEYARTNFHVWKF